MPPEVSLRSVRPDDLPIFFDHQADADAARMAAFPSRNRDAFMAHWAKILIRDDVTNRTILLDGHVVGNIGAWSDAHERLISYWIGREHWGQGIATSALRQFLALETFRPLTAHVAAHNAGSIRVLQKCGFVISGEEQFTWPDGTPGKELILKLGPAL